MKRLLVLATVLATVTVALPALAISTEVDLQDAFGNGDSPIVLTGDVTITTALVWSEVYPLVIDGNGYTIDGDVTGALIHVTSGADVHIENLTLDGTSTNTIDDPGGANGLRVDLPDSSTGTVLVELTDTTVRNTGLHGIYVDDITTPSPASVELDFDGVIVENAGIGGFDEDGVRVDERGDGSVRFTAAGSSFIAAGADGVELDEGGDGDVVFDVRDSSFRDNGNYCSFRFSDAPAIVTDGDVEVEIADDDTLDEESDVEDLLLGTIDPPLHPDVEDEYRECIEAELDDEVWEVGLDLDDAFDIDEAGAGDISGVVVDVELIDNYDEGLDYDEEDAGGIDATAVAVRAFGNVDEAIKYSEEDAGDVTGVVKGTKSDGDLEFEEEGPGDVSGTILGSAFDDIEMSEDGPGDGTAKVQGTKYDDLELFE